MDQHSKKSPYLTDIAIDQEPGTEELEVPGESGTSSSPYSSSSLDSSSPDLSFPEPRTRRKPKGPTKPRYKKADIEAAKVAGTSAETAVAFAERRLDALIPFAALELDWQLKFGSEKARRESLFKLLESKQLLKTSNVGNVTSIAPVIQVNISKPLPWDNQKQVTVVPEATGITETLEQGPQESGPQEVKESLNLRSLNAPDDT